MHGPVRDTRPPAAGVFLAGLALVLSGCAVLPSSPDARTAATPSPSAGGGTAATSAGGGTTAASAAPADGTGVSLDLGREDSLPRAVRELLERHLDLARLARMADGTTLGEAELTRLVEAAPAQVASLLRTEGYFSPRVVVRRSVGEAGGPARVGLDIELGPRARVSSLELSFDKPPKEAGRGDEGFRGKTGDGDANSQATSNAASDATNDASRVITAARERWALQVGTPFRNPDWTEAKSDALARLRAQGYTLARWVHTRAEVDAPRASVRLTGVLDTGPLFRTGGIVIEGLRLHEAQTVRNLAGFEPGTPATEALLLDYQDRLVKSGLFARASVTLDAADAAAATSEPARAQAVTVRVEVAETTRHELTTGIGVSANTGPRVTAEHIDRRFLGYAATVRNHLEWARSRQAWDGEVATHPGPTMARWLAGGTVERLEGTEDVVLSQRVRAGWNKEAARLDRFTFAQLDRSARKTASERSSSVAVTANQNMTWRRLDNPVLPTEGYTLSVQAGLGQAWDSADVEGRFARLWSRLQWYQPLARTWYAQARLEAGQVFAPSGLEVPDSLRFRAGGDDSVRGYAYRSLGPVDGTAVGSGDALVTASIELARPIRVSLPQFWGAVFVDAGRAADSFQGLKPAIGYGVGLRWRSPVGPLRLDLARGQETGENRLHFSLGIAF